MKNNNTQQLLLPPFIHDNGTHESERSGSCGQKFDGLLFLSKALSLSFDLFWDQITCILLGPVK